MLEFMEILHYMHGVCVIWMATTVTSKTTYNCAVAIFQAFENLVPTFHLLHIALTVRYDVIDYHVQLLPDLSGHWDE